MLLLLNWSDLPFNQSSGLFCFGVIWLPVQHSHICKLTAGWWIPAFLRVHCISGLSYIPVCLLGPRGACLAAVSQPGSALTANNNRAMEVGNADRKPIFHIVLRSPSTTAQARLCWGLRISQARSHGIPGPQLSSQSIPGWEHRGPVKAGAGLGAAKRVHSCPWLLYEAD